MPSRPVRLSLAHLTVMPADPLTLVEAAHAGGFDGIGLRIVPPLPGDRIVEVVGNETLVRDLQHRLDDLGIRVFDVEAIWLGPDTDVAALAPALDLAQRLGAGHVLTVGNDHDRIRLVDRFALLCALAGARDLKVALEPISYAPLATPADGLALIRASGAGNAGLLIDALHFFRAGSRPEELAAVDPGLLPYVHLCDAPLQSPPPEALRAEGRGGRLDTGEGALALGALMAALPAGIPVAIEAPMAGGPVDPVARARRCGAATRRFLAGIGRD